ncbi:MAG: phospholipid/cholesterol/gamma-HCH transport system substrate-binding protein [Frankiales bacterium]|jgi:phospholipid/cholesterol/gamma-HCH transport system substrate-binding protein|nr:phospholipid/cholesterol/gamma-HCH transport system substrate-binding protein [Frankiales bacterium]
MYDTFWTRQGYRLLGLVFFTIVGSLIALSLQAYSKAFTPITKVDLEVSGSGQLLLPGSDVKVRGLLVGEVRSIDSNGQHATIHMALHPADAHKLPANVTARITPKTVFGEKYVDLMMPSDPVEQSLAEAPRGAGNVPTIGLDRSKPALEISRVLSDVLPLLRSINPQQLSLTLTAVASALEGRGEKLGETMELLDSYLIGFNPQIDVLKQDITKLADVATTYDAAAPDLLRILNNLIVTSRTVVAEKETIATFLSDVTQTANKTNSLLTRSATNLIQVNKVNKDLLALLARYSPEFPCFFEGYAKLGPQVRDSLGTTRETLKSAHIVIEFGRAVPEYQYPIDLPEYNDNRGPNCYGLPNPQVPLPQIHLNDGTEDDPRFNPPTNAQFSGTSAGPASTGGPGSAAERSMVDALLAPVLQTNSVSVPDIADLLWGPMARGQQVSLR